MGTRGPPIQMKRELRYYSVKYVRREQYTREYKKGSKCLSLLILKENCILTTRNWNDAEIVATKANSLGTKGEKWVVYIKRII